MSNSLDAFWERLSAANPRFALSDATDADTHRNHALVTVLLFGTLGAIAGRLAFDWRIGTGLEVGYAVGVGFYVVRELWWRIQVIVARRVAKPYDTIELSVKATTPLRLFDGWMDVLVPVWITAPAVFGSVVLLWILSALVAASYFLLRPVR